MRRLTESMQGLREAIKQQENELTNFVENGGFREIELLPNRELSEEHQKLFQLSNEQIQSKFEPELYSAGSDISQVSHWSCNLDTINTSIGDLKGILKNQEKQVIRLITENEELKNELKKKEKELRKQKFLLKAERDTFEQYKKDTLNDVKKYKSEESQDVKPNKDSLEILKVKSELSHYRQLYVEQCHTMNRLSKLISSLKDDKVQLKVKLLQQEKRSNKFILEMAQRFDVSRKDLRVIAEKKFESLPIPPTNLAVYKLADRNARLAHDNSMLKLELNILRQQLFDTKVEEHKLQCLKTRSELLNKPQNNIDDLSNIIKQNNGGDINRVITLKSSTKESILTVGLNEFKGSVVSPVLTSLIENNSEVNSTWHQDLDETVCDDLDIFQRKCMNRSPEEPEVERTASAPTLRTSKVQS